MEKGEFSKSAQDSHSNDPKYVLPVRTAKHIALSMSLWWCSKGSRIRCSTTPASI